MSFRITPKDVGRKVITRDGNKAVIIACDDDETMPFEVRHFRGNYYHTPTGSITKEQMKNDMDIIAWADEPVTDQPRPKDLRDEFAMVALSGITANARWFLPTNPPSDINAEYAKKAYAIADAMIKARGK
jgi:hypothetical protein